MQIAVEIFHITKALPRSEDYGLTSQVRRAGLSISNNIAEGFGRVSKKDKANFYIISRGSAFESLNCLEYGMQTGYFESEEKKKIDDKINDVIHELNKIINSLNPYPISPQP